jgi:hypothetical protein
MANKPSAPAPAGNRARRLALARLIERNLPAKPQPGGESVVPDSALAEAVKALKE